MKSDRGLKMVLVIGLNREQISYARIRLASSQLEQEQICSKHLSIPTLCLYFGERTGTKDGRLGKTLKIFFRNMVLCTGLRKVKSVNKEDPATPIQATAVQFHEVALQFSHFLQRFLNPTSPHSKNVDGCDCISMF
jgi:hypothetical protein